MNNNDSNDSHNKFKRKKKRSFAQRVQKRYKTGDFCKGTRLDSLEHEYFLRVFKLCQDFQGTTEEKVVFANNALTQVDGREVECSNNQLVSRVIEGLLPLASNKNLRKFFDAFGADLRPICDQAYASHILQALMIVAHRHSLETFAWQKKKSAAAHQTECKEWLLKVCKYLLNNIEEFMSGTFANPTLRTAMYCLAASPQLDKHNDYGDNKFLKGIMPTQLSDQQPPEEFKHLLEEFCERITLSPQFKDFGKNPLSSGFLQSLLRALKHVKSKSYRSLCNKIITECFYTDPASAMSSSIALPLLEVIMELDDKGKKLKKIYTMLLAERLGELCTARSGNQTIQKFLNNCSDRELVAEVVSGLVPEFPKIIQSKTAGVLVSLCQACERLRTAQSEFYQGLVKALNCEQAVNELIPAILCLSPLPLSTPPPNTTPWGSIIIQGLLKFQKPIKLIKSLFSYSDEKLSELLSSIHGCHITTAFCQSEFVGEKSKQELVKRLMGQYSKMAQSKYGSRSFDDLWTMANDKARGQIASELEPDYNKLFNSQFGKYVCYKVRLDDFRKLDRSRWLTSLQDVDKKKKLFADITEGLKEEK